MPRDASPAPVLVRYQNEDDLTAVTDALRRAWLQYRPLTVDASSAGRIDLPTLTRLTRLLAPAVTAGVPLRVIAPSGEDGRLARHSPLATAS